ncbi:MAG TPA: hypothetical protein VKW04_03060 [Planctomycetota bacterium]|nr:hypothetical protein [Planctomycetota bacterium]
MGVSVYVMPLHTWLTGDFRTTWGPDAETASAPRRRQSSEDAERLRDEFVSQLEPLIGRRPEWNEGGPARSATAFSVHAFSLPFLQARRWAYRMRLPQLSVLETPQIWIPPVFEPVLRLDSWWGDGGDLLVGSLPRIRSELDRLLEALAREEAAGDWAELRELARVGEALRDLAGAGIEADLPVIVDG